MAAHNAPIAPVVILFVGFITFSDRLLNGRTLSRFHCSREISMQTWIGLFRGINVGGHNILPMAKLKSDLESLKLKNVRTYIQSGNVVFDATAKTASSLAEKIGGRIEKQHGFRPHLLILNREDLLAAIESNPFPKAVHHPRPFTTAIVTLG